jgi:hypothetical protein
MLRAAQSIVKKYLKIDQVDKERLMEKDLYIQELEAQKAELKADIERLEEEKKTLQQKYKIRLNQGHK